MPSGLGAHCLEMCSYAPKFFTKLLCSSKTDSNTSGSTHGLLKCLGPPLPDMPFCKGKATTLLAKSLFSKTGPSGPLIFAKFLFAKVFFKKSFLKKRQSMAAERNYRLKKKVLVYGCICIYIYIYIDSFDMYIPAVV